MRSKLEKVGWALAGSDITIALALSYGVATGQQARPGAGRGVQVQGTIAQKDLEHNAVLVNTRQGQRWVQLPQGTRILKSVDATVGDLKEKEFVTISGVPTAIDATTIQVSDAPPAPAGAAAAPGGAAAAPGPGRQGGAQRMNAFARVSGTVESLEPLTLVVPESQAKVTVATNDKTQITRQLQIEVKDVAEGEQFTAFGQVDDRQVLQARFAAVGDAQGLFGGGMFGGGMFGGGAPAAGRQGGRRGGGAQR